MSQSTGHQGGVGDPCAEFGPVQRWAVVWFVSIIIGGIIFVGILSNIDNWMYSHNAEFLDYKAYRENRYAHTSVKSSQMDPRARGDLHTALERAASPSQ